MGAAAVLQDPLAPRRVRTGASAPGRRGHLRLVGVDHQVPPTRLTRRGRLTLTLAVTSALVAAVASTVLLLGPTGASTEVVVRSGQTLSEVAVTHLPELPLDRAIVRIQLANGMNTAQVQAGQTLVVPGG